MLPFGRLWYTKPDDAVGYAMHYSRSADAVIRVYDAAGDVIETHEHRGRFQRVVIAIYVRRSASDHYVATGVIRTFDARAARYNTDSWR